MVGVSSPSNQIQNQDFVEDQSIQLDEWPPITASRNAKWYSLAFHNVTAIVGVGVLGLPDALSELGWGPGVVVLILSWAMAFYTHCQMIEMHEMFEGQEGLDMHRVLGQAAFGKKLGFYIIVPLQLLDEICACIIYLVTGAESLKTVHQLWIGEDKCTDMTIRHFILIFATSQFVLSLIKNANSIFGVSLVAAVMSVSYSTYAWVASLTKGVIENVDYGYKKRTIAVPLAFLSGLGQIAFAQATIPSTPENPSKRPMWKGAIVAYIILAFCYFLVALVGFYTFGNNVEENILQSLNKPNELIIMVNMLVVLHLLGNYQLYAMPSFDMMESVMIKKWHFRPTKVLRFTIRSTYAAITMGIAVSLPYFSALQSVFGGFVSAPFTYFIPCIIWLILKKPKKYSPSWCSNLVCIILGVLLMITATIGGLAKLFYHISNDALPNSNSNCTQSSKK